MSQHALQKIIPRHAPSRLNLLTSWEVCPLCTSVNKMGLMLNDTIRVNRREHKLVSCHYRYENYNTVGISTRFHGFYQSSDVAKVQDKIKANISILKEKIQTTKQLCFGYE